MKQEYDYNNPIRKDRFDIMINEDNGKKKVLGFKYGENYYRQTYNYTKSYGFKFITKYKTYEGFIKPISVSGEEMIYSSTMQSDCTPEGRYIDFSLSRYGL